MNATTINNLNILLGLGAIFLQIFSIISLFILLFGPKKNFLLDFINKNFLPIIFLISLLSTLFSLVYSEVIRYAPCYLCWFQRVFIYPLVFLFGIAMWDKDRKVIKYALPLVCAGFLVSIYQNFEYYFGATGSTFCGSSGVSCYQQFVSVFGGYISIPMLALTAFFAILVVILVVHFYNNNNNNS